MSKLTRLVCDSCGSAEVSANLRLSLGDNSSVADLCAVCAQEIASGIDGLRTQKKRGRKAKVA